jgi:hypothetical protein
MMSELENIHPMLFFPTKKSKRKKMIKSKSDDDGKLNGINHSRKPITDHSQLSRFRGIQYLSLSESNRETHNIPT